MTTGHVVKWRVAVRGIVLLLFLLGCDDHAPAHDAPVSRIDAQPDADPERSCAQASDCDPGWLCALCCSPAGACFSMCALETSSSCSYARCADEGQPCPSGGTCTQTTITMVGGTSQQYLVCKQPSARVRIADLLAVDAAETSAICSTPRRLEAVLLHLVGGRNVLRTHNRSASRQVGCDKQQQASLDEGRPK